MVLRSALVSLLLLQSTDFQAEGMKALEAQKYSDAAGLFAKAAEADPKDYGAHFHLALSLSLLNRDAEAITEYRKVLDLKPGLYEAGLNLAILLLRGKNAVEAVPFFNSSVEAKPKEFRPRFYLGEALYAAGDAAKAEEQYRLAADLDPKSAGAQLGLGRAQAAQKRLAEGAVHFQKAAELDPSYKDALLELASLHEKNGQPLDAMAIYRQFPDNSGAQERLGELLIELKQAGDAIPVLEKAVARDPTPANRLALATAYRLNKQVDKAIPLLEAAIAGDPNNYAIRMLLGRVLRDEKKYAAAAQLFYGAAQKQPESKEAWNELAGMLLLVEDYERALTALDRVKALGGETPANHYFRAITLDKLKLYEPALDSYQSFLAASQGQRPDEEFKARQRIRIIQKELSKR